MKIQISLSLNEVRVLQNVVTALGGKTKEIQNKVEGYGALTNEVEYDDFNGLTLITSKIDECFVTDVYQVVIKHSAAIRGVIATAKGLYETYMALCLGMAKDLKEVSEKYFKA